MCIPDYTFAFPVSYHPTDVYDDSFGMWSFFTWRFHLLTVAMIFVIVGLVLILLDPEGRVMFLLGWSRKFISCSSLYKRAFFWSPHDRSSHADWSFYRTVW